MPNEDAKVEWARLQLKKALARYRTLGISDNAIRADVEADIKENQNVPRIAEASDYIDRLVDADQEAIHRALGIEAPPARPKSKAAKAGQ